MCKKGRYMNAIEEFEIYRAFKKDPNNILNEQLEFKSHILYDKIIDNTNIDYTPQHNNRERSSKLCSTLSTSVECALTSAYVSHTCGTCV